MRARIIRAERAEHMTEQTSDHTFDIAVIGAGSASEAFVRAMGDGYEIVVFEPRLVGGECPFLACMPSKAMLHDVATHRSWADAVARRDEIVSHLDDTEHAAGLKELGASIVRERAMVTGPGVVRAGGKSYRVDHVLIATGAEPIFPDIDGLDPSHELVWTSRDALTATERPESVVIVGGGVIGSELAYMFAGFGVSVTTLDESDRPADDMHPAVSGIITKTLERAGVDVVNSVEVSRIELTDDDTAVHLADGSIHRAERVIISTGRAPSLRQLGLEDLGVDPDNIEVDDRGALVGTSNVWVAGDAAGREQYTHVANHHGVVVADQIAGDGTRRYGESVVPACVFIDPPVMVVGDSWASLRDDDDVVWAEVELDEPRNSTDEHDPGFLAVAARRSTGRIVAANGIGARFDELVHALVIAIDGETPVARLQRTIQPFPTVGEVLAAAFDQLGDQLAN